MDEETIKMFSSWDIDSIVTDNPSMVWLGRFNYVFTVSTKVYSRYDYEKEKEKLNQAFGLKSRFLIPTDDDIGDILLIGGIITEIREEFIEDGVEFKVKILPDIIETENKISVPELMDKLYEKELKDIFKRGLNHEYNLP